VEAPLSGYRKKHVTITNRTRGASVSEHTYKVTEIVGTSPDGIDQAIRNGVERAAQTLRNLDWFEIVEVRGHLQDGAVDHFQVTMKVGFRMEDA
jgi:flavin-binding protein dodecin